MTTLAALPDPIAGTPVDLTKVRTDNTKLDLVVVLAVSKMDWHLAMKWLRLAARFSQQAPLEAPIFILHSPALNAGQKFLLQKAAIELQCGCGDLVAADLKEIGYYGSANQMFLRALELCEKHAPGKAMLWCESDTVPLRKEWLADIVAEYRACGRPFMGDVHLCERNHMTGNAVYHPQWRKYAPSLARILEDLSFGWDSQCADETFPQCHVAKTIQQIWRPKEITVDFLNSLRPETALFHQDKSGHLIDLVCDRDGILRFGNYEPIERPTYDDPPFLRPTLDSAPGTKMEIFIVTHWKDVEYLRYTVRSIQRFATGFTGVTVAVPASENDGRYTFLPKGINVVFYDDPVGKGFLAHLLTKCMADQLCPEADFILHLDPDCMFMDKVSPKDYLPGGKPLLVFEPYSVCGAKNPARLIWQGVTQRAIGGALPLEETMVRHPQVHRRATYGILRSAVQTHTRQKFADYVYSCANAFPQGFAEFPSLGAIAIRHLRELYSLVEYDRNKDAVETGTDPAGNWQYIYRMGRDKVVEFYSKNPVQQYWPAMNAILAGQHQLFYVK